MASRVRVEVDQAALNSVRPGRMLNDTAIEFYMQHLLNQLCEPKRNTIHIFSSFFYKKIKNLYAPYANASKDLIYGCDDEIYDTIRRWDKYVKIFDKDYLVLPICEAHHWMLVIVCFAHQVQPDQEIVLIDEKETTHQPMILIFDSMGYHYMSKFTEPIRDFLNSRWKFERQHEKRRLFKDRTLLPDVSARVSRQENSYDCGIHLLQNFKMFISDPYGNYLKIRDNRHLNWSIDTRSMRETVFNLMSSHLETSLSWPQSYMEPLNSSVQFLPTPSKSTDLNKTF